MNGSIIKAQELTKYFYLRPRRYIPGVVQASGRPGVQASVRPSVRLCMIFEHLPIIRISRNSQGRCTLDRVTIGHMSRSCRIKVKVTAGHKLVILVIFIVRFLHLCTLYSHGFSHLASDIILGAQTSKEHEPYSFGCCFAHF